MKIDFDAPHCDADPWGYESHWYEARRRQLIAAMLPSQQLGDILELGCSTGLITELLAPRSQHVLALELSYPAVERAQQRLQPFPHVRIQHADVRTDWPAQRFDGFLLCDLGYYLEQPHLEGLAQRIRDSAKAHSFVLAAHWRHAFAQVVTATDQVHKTMAAGTGMLLQAHYEDKDLLIDLWSTSSQSVAQKEGLA